MARNPMRATLSRAKTPSSTTTRVGRSDVSMSPTVPHALSTASISGPRQCAVDGMEAVEWESNTTACQAAYRPQEEEERWPTAGCLASYHSPS